MFVVLGWCVAVLGISGVALGALAAHAGLSDHSVSLIEIGLRYHIPHGIAAFAGLVAVSAWGANRRAQNRMLVAISLWVLGAFAFSGGLYVQAFANLDAGYIVPAGGFAFMLGWLAVGWSLYGVRNNVHQTTRADS